MTATADPRSLTLPPPPALPADSLAADIGTRATVLLQLAVTGGPLLVGSLFPIGVPVYSTLFGEIGKYNCLSHLLTGYPCPACGLTSGVVACLHGQIGLSVAYHPLGWAFTLLFVGGFLGGLLKLRRLVLPELPAPASWELWFLRFPPNHWFNWLAAGFVALIAGRTLYWAGPYF